MRNEHANLNETERTTMQNEMNEKKCTTTTKINTLTTKKQQQQPKQQTLYIRQKQNKAKQ